MIISCIKKNLTTHVWAVEEKSNRSSLLPCSTFCKFDRSRKACTTQTLIEPFFCKFNRLKKKLDQLNFIRTFIVLCPTGRSFNRFIKPIVQPVEGKLDLSGFCRMKNKWAEHMVAIYSWIMINIYRDLQY